MYRSAIHSKLSFEDLQVERSVSQVEAGLNLGQDLNLFNFGFHFYYFYRCPEALYAIKHVEYMSFIAKPNLSNILFLLVR